MSLYAYKHTGWPQQHTAHTTKERTFLSSLEKTKLIPIKTGNNPPRQNQQQQHRATCLAGQCRTRLEAPPSQQSISFSCFSWKTRDVFSFMACREKRGLIRPQTCVMCVCVCDYTRWPLSRMCQSSFHMSYYESLVAPKLLLVETWKGRMLPANQFGGCQWSVQRPSSSSAQSLHFFSLRRAREREREILINESESKKAIRRKMGVKKKAVWEVWLTTCPSGCCLLANILWLQSPFDNCSFFCCCGRSVVSTTCRFRCDL